MERNKILSKKNIMIISFLAILAGILIFLSETFGTEDVVKRISRNSYDGGMKTEHYQVEIDGKEEEIEIKVSPRKYSSKEIQTLWESAMEELDKVVLGENDSKDDVSKQIVLPQNLEGYPFVISWELSRYDVMNMSGELIEEELKKADPENKGVPLSLTGILSYEEYQTIYQTELLLFAKEEKLKPAEELQRMVETLDMVSQEKEYLELPEEWKGEPLIWKTVDSGNVLLIIVFGLSIILLLFLREKQKDAQQKKNRREEMLREYPEIISQFTMLMGAGMTAKRVWGKLAEDYKKEKSLSGNIKSAYEEILFTWQEMQSGIPEAQCYERFGKRCELLPYMKMGVLLSQNLRKGSKGLSEMLALEAVEAMEERKNRARRLGEEAGTKLLIPMTIMLVVVLAIVVVPAFWTTEV